MRLSTVRKQRSGCRHVSGRRCQNASTGRRVNSVPQRGPQARQEEQAGRHPAAGSCVMRTARRVGVWGPLGGQQLTEDVCPEKRTQMNGTPASLQRFSLYCLRGTILPGPGEAVPQREAWPFRCCQNAPPPPRALLPSAPAHPQREQVAPRGSLVHP